MKPFDVVRVSRIFLWMSVLAVLIVPQAAKATSQTWQASVGAQSKDAGRQAMAFLPNELWIYQNDSITWTSKAGEGHTVSFLKLPEPPAMRPSMGAGCTGGGQGGTSPTTPNGSSYDGTECVNSGPICNRSLQQTPDITKCTNGTTYTVTFPTAGNFKFVCLIHQDMTGVVHVLATPTALALPHDQDFYDDQAADQAREIISDTDHRDGARDRDDERDEHGKGSSRNGVITTGEVIATGGGRRYLTITRFLPGTIHVHVGETVEWTNMHPTEPHTITFYYPPFGPGGIAPPPGTGVTPDLDGDGDLHGTLSNPLTSIFNSGPIGAALQDQTGRPQPAPGTTRVRVTFTGPGEYNYYCTFHAELGMVGKVIVRGP